MVVVGRGVDNFFSKHSPNWRVLKNFHSPSQKTTGPIYWICQWERKNPFARLASGFVFLLAKSELYSHLASWQVVIRIPVVGINFKSMCMYKYILFFHLALPLHRLPLPFYPWPPCPRFPPSPTLSLSFPFPSLLANKHSYLGTWSVEWSQSLKHERHNGIN
jgi:hypothetical protein